jgi:two-component system chemotaxis response regulator CheY
MRYKADFPNLNTKIPDGIAPGGRHYKVMVVDSREFNRKQIVQILESEEYDIVATASNGKEALAHYDRLNGKLDLITTELDMSVLDGYALTYELKERGNTAPVVFISDETTKGVMQDLILMGVKDYILKPVNRRILLERIKKVMVKYSS